MAYTLGNNSAKIFVNGQFYFILSSKMWSHVFFGTQCIFRKMRTYANVFLPRDAMHKRGLCRHAVSVCLSVTFVSCVKTNKDVFEFFSPSGSQAILVFPRQTGWRYSDRNHPNGGAECKEGMKNSRFSTNISL